MTPHGVGRCQHCQNFRIHKRGDSPRGGEMPAGQRGPLSTRGTAVRRWRGSLVKCSFTMSKPSGGIRSLHSLSAWGLPTPVVAFSCIGNVDIQVFSCAGGRLYFIRRLQVYLFIIFHVQPISQGVTLLFFFTEKKKRSKKRKEFAFHLCYKVKYHTKITRRKNPPAGQTGGCCRRNITLFTVEIGA